MRKFTTDEVGKLYKLNSKLVDIEEKIYNRAKEQNQTALKILLSRENDITDYELEINIAFYTNKNEDELISWDEYIKHHFLDDKHENINDKENHNVTSCCWKQEDLNSQKHCWLLHRLYDDFDIEWDDIFKINLAWFDVKVIYQYKIDIVL